MSFQVFRKNCNSTMQFWTLFPGWVGTKLGTIGISTATLAENIKSEVH